MCRHLISTVGFRLVKPFFRVFIEILSISQNRQENAQMLVDVAQCGVNMS